MRPANARILAPLGSPILVAVEGIPSGENVAEYALRWSAAHPSADYVTAGYLSHRWHQAYARVSQVIEVNRWR